jgi:hypothetical protein
MYLTTIAYHVNMRLTTLTSCLPCICDATNLIDNASSLTCHSSYIRFVKSWKGDELLFLAVPADNGSERNYPPLGLLLNSRF